MYVLRLAFALFALPAFAQEPTRTFGDETEVCACYADNKAACVRYDKPQELGLAAIEWHLFGGPIPVEEWTACDDARCYGTDEEIAKACEPKGWVVAENKIPLKTTQPVVSCDAKCLKDRKLGKALGRSGPEIVTPCEGPLTPPWLNGKLQYQFTTTDKGRGLAPCQQAE